LLRLLLPFLVVYLAVSLFLLVLLVLLVLLLNHMQVQAMGGRAYSTMDATRLDSSGQAAVPVQG
jgi:hypothetical protein